jgi:hypothetical protein
MEMSSHEKWGSLDGAIDQAVREMMQVDARPGLRHRVARAISAPPHQPRRFGFGVVAFAVALMVITSVLVLRPSRPATPVHAPQVATTSPAAPVAPLAGPTAVDAPRRAPNFAAAPMRSQDRPAPTPESIFGPRRTRVAAASIPLIAAEPTTVETWVELPRDAERSGIARITVAPIEVAPLAIQPLFAAGTPSGPGTPSR